MSVLTVGAGKEFTTLASAVAASHDGDTIEVQAGTYVNDFVTVADKITIEGVGGTANFVATEAPPNGKAILTIDNSATVQNLGFSGTAVPDGNGAGIRLEAGSLVVDGCNFAHNQMGILTANDASISLTVLNSEFGGQLSSGALAHQLYAGNIGHLDVENSLFLADTSGHQIKSRAADTVIKNNIIDDGHGNTSYDIDLPNGGAATIQGNTIVKGVNDANTTVISYGEEGMKWSTNALTVQHNVIDNQLTGGHGIGVSNVSSVVAHIDDNQFYNLPTVAVGPNEQTGNVALTTAPAVDDIIPGGASPSPAPAPTPTPDPVSGSPSPSPAPAPSPSPAPPSETPPGEQPVIAHPDAQPMPHVARHFVVPDHSGTATGSSHPSVLLATGSHQTLIGHGGDDIFLIGASSDTKIVEAGHGTATVITAAHDYALPTGIADLIGTGHDPQHLTGNSGNDYIQGNDGNDIIHAGSGNATIAVGTGANTLTGGAGPDLFVFSSTADHDNVITNFKLGHDELDLTGVLKAAHYQGADPVADHVLRLVPEGHDTAIVVDPHGNGAGAHTVVTLDNIVASSLKAGHDFIWH